MHLKFVLDDFNVAIKYSRKALEVGAKTIYADGLRMNLAGIYKTNADIAYKLGAYQIALEFYEAGQNYLTRKYSQCAYYATWGNVYLKLKKFDKAIETFDNVPLTNNAYCAELFGNSGDAFTAKGEFQEALSDYNRALTYDQSDSLMRKGWLYIKRAKLFLQLGKAEQALTDLNAATEKKYIAYCPQVYEVRAETYRKLGKPELAKSDIQTANKLKNRANCP